MAKTNLKALFFLILCSCLISITAQHKSSNTPKGNSTVDFISGQIKPTRAGTNSMSKMKYAHSIFITINWGILTPVGIIMERYVKGAYALRFSLSCQLLGALLGVIGSQWSRVYKFAHGCIDIIVSLLATIKFLVSKWKPNKDHKHSKYWNAFNYILGYATIILGKIDIFTGFHILAPSKMWKYVYIGGFIAALLEWVIKRNGRDAEKKTRATKSLENLV